jgi:hypothetical protein
MRQNTPENCETMRQNTPDHAPEHTREL